jgi:CRP-like cAMP-binding protein
MKFRLYPDVDRSVTSPIYSLWAFNQPSPSCLKRLIFSRNWVRRRVEKGFLDELLLAASISKLTTRQKMKEIVELSDKEITIDRNEFLKVKGSIDTNLYYVESGSLRIFVLDDYEEQTIRLGYKENLIVSLDSFLTGKPSDLYIQAIKKTVVKVVTKEQIDLLLKNETNQNLWTKILENLVVQQMEREIDILTNSPKERYERVLKRSPQLFQEIPNRHIANYLRMSAETLSRLKKS